jgi:hypothetical protein
MVRWLLKTLLLAACAGILADAEDAAPAWRFQRQQQLRTVTGEGRADTPDGPATARRMLFCREGKGGWTGLEFTVYRAGGESLDGFKGFHFQDFEGPDAPAQRRRLTELGVAGGARPLQVTVNQTGSYSASMPGFTFSTGGPNRGTNPVKQLLRSVAVDSETLTVKVQDSQDPGAAIAAEFPAAGLSRLIRQLLKDY